MFASELGLEMVAINDKYNGFLPHDPEPRPRASMQVQALIEPLNADIGFCFNSDMSRCAMVTEDGETLSEEYSFPLVANHILAQESDPATVVTNISTTRALDDVVSRHRATLIKCPVGQSTVIDKMQESKAILAGEGCGSVAYSKHQPAYDGWMMMAKVLEAMALNEATSSELVTNLNRQYNIRKRRIFCPTAKSYSVIHQLRDAFPDAEINDMDGLRFDWEDGWAHIRPSNTSPIVRLIVEWKGKEAAIEKLNEFSSHVERYFGS